MIFHVLVFQAKQLQVQLTAPKIRIGGPDCHSKKQHNLDNLMNSVAKYFSAHVQVPIQNRLSFV
jgi:hypothetical protein